MSSEPITIYARDLPVRTEGGVVKCGIDEDKLIELCGQFANVDPKSIVVKVVDNYNGFPCCYAIIQLENQNDADRLISKLNYKTIKKIPIHLVLFDEEVQNIIRNDDGRTLLIHDINPSVQLNDLYDMFKPYGEIVDCEMPFGSDNIAYVLFRKPDDAQRAMESLNGTSPTGVIPIQIEVDRSQTFTKKFVLPDQM